MTDRPDVNSIGHPKASIIMPCFNHSKFLTDSVNGIRRQTCQDLELIIVDDCSSDTSWERIQDMARQDTRIKTIHHTCNQGASKSRNDGLHMATGQFIAFCDADDIWECDKLRIQMNLLQNNPTFDVVYCDALFIDESGSLTGMRFSERFPPPKSFSGRLFNDLVTRNFINIQSVLMRKECVQRAGYFDEGIKWVEDWWYWIRLSRDHSFLYTEEPLARYRVHSRSTNLVQKRGYCVNRFKVFRRILRSYSDLPNSAKSKVVFNMGAELCDLGKLRAGRRLLWNAVGLSMTDLQAFSSFCQALRRLMLT